MYYKSLQKAKNMKQKNRNKIIAFPFAGGNSFSFQNIEKYIPPQFEWITLELPGRGTRFEEKLLKTTKAAVNDLFYQLKPLIQDGSYLFYGHSMGTLLGYELTKRLVKENMTLPVCLFVTGRGAPSKLEKEKWSDLPFDHFWKKIYEIGGLPKEFLKNDDLLDLFYPILKSDFKMIETYKYQKLESPLPVPIHVCIGKEEIGKEKNKISMDQIANWDNETTFPMNTEFLDGDHFFILKHAQLMAQKISQALTNGLVENRISILKT